MLKRFALALLASLMFFALSQTTKAATTCVFTASGTTWTLNADCTTDTSIIIPNGFTIDGAGHTITAVDPVSGHFVGGPYYDGAFCVNVQIDKNTLTGNDVGVFLSQLEADGSAPIKATNIKVVNNEISNDAVNNPIYQAGVSDVGNNDKIINNKISGIGYNPATIPGVTFAVDADASFTNRAKVHANK